MALDALVEKHGYGPVRREAVRIAARGAGARGAGERIDRLAYYTRAIGEDLSQPAMVPAARPQTPPPDYYTRKGLVTSCKEEDSEPGARARAMQDLEKTLH